MTTTTPTLPLKGRTARIRHLCPYHYLVREDFLFGGREGLTPCREGLTHREEIHQRMKEQVLPNSVTILSYDLIAGQPLPWMQDKGWNEGYAYLLFYCTTHDPFLQGRFMDQTTWLYRQHTTPEDQAHVQADVQQYEALRVLVRDSMQQSDLVDRAEQMPVHEPDPAMPEFIIRRRGAQQDIVPAAPLPTPAPLPEPAPTRPVQQRKHDSHSEEEEERDEAKNFLIKERELVNLLSSWRGDKSSRY